MDGRTVVATACSERPTTDNRNAFPLMAIAAALCSSLPAFADAAIIVNPKKPIASLTA